MVGSAEAEAAGSAEARGPLLVRFDTDARDQLTYARVRMACAVLGSGGAIAMLLGDLPLPALLVAVLALFVSVLWLRQARRAARLAKSGRSESLHVHRLGFALDEGERTHWVPWSNVEGIIVDEDRLDIVVQQSDAARMRIEPRYPGVDIYELVRTLNDARLSARANADRQGGAPLP